MTATVLRSHLFEALEKAVQGEPVEVSYKGKLLRIIPESGASKLARAKRQHALAVDPDLIISDKQALEEMEAAWKEDWDAL